MHLVLLWDTIYEVKKKKKGLNLCRNFMKFGVRVLKKMSSKCQFGDCRLSSNRTLQSE